MENINKEDMFRIGVITEPHGIKGEVKVYPTTDEPERMGKIKTIYMDMGKELMELQSGDNVVLTGGQIGGQVGNTNIIKVEVIK